jgi:hypothetical protein
VLVVRVIPGHQLYSTRFDDRISNVSLLHRWFVDSTFAVYVCIVVLYFVASNRMRPLRIMYSLQVSLSAFVRLFFNFSHP